MSKHVDYKCTIWGRLHFNDSVDTQEIIKKLEEGFQPAELCDIPELKFESFNFIDDTEESLSLKGNNHESTIEVYEEEDFPKCVWENGKKHT